MKKDFFEEFEVQDKAIHKSISIGENDWSLVEAYRLYGVNRKKQEFPIHKMISDILIKHINSDKRFVKEQDTWLQKIEGIREATDDR